MKTIFKRYEEADYQRVCDFFVELNRKEETHIHWNWARWEWMYFHPYFDRSRMDTIGLWKEEARVVGIALYDLFYGEAFCAALEGHRELMPEILAYAVETFQNENGLGIAVNDKDEEMKACLKNAGFQEAEQNETVLSISMEQRQVYSLAEGMKLREIHFPEDNLAYQTIIWKGFDHGDDPEELEKMLRNSPNLPIHRNSFLCLAVVDKEDQFVAHCTCWYDKGTDYAYVEPVCTIPEYRKRGLGRAVVLEALNRCRELGARKAVVISDQEFYKGMGFEEQSHYTFYWVKTEKNRLLET